jgi:hypothetical protein
MEPIATYSAHSIEWKSDFFLFGDAIVLRYSRGIFGQRGEERFPLTTLDPAYVRLKFRRDVFITAGGLIALFSLLVGVRLFAAHAISWPLLFVVAAFVFGVVLVRAGFRMVECAQFQTQGGGVGFRIPCYGRHDEFEAFIGAVAGRILDAKRAA